jgi:hypothetical protein
MPQVLQPEELQLPQPPVPARGADSPAAFLEKEAKVDSLRRAVLCPSGQEMTSSDWLSDRSRSNFAPQSEQTYSYIGIFFLLI